MRSRVSLRHTGSRQAGTPPRRLCTVALAGVFALGVAHAQQQGPEIAANPDGTVTVKNAAIPLSGLLSADGKEVLRRTRPTEGPGAPVPLPTNMTDMAELRRVYNENLKPNVDHMREVFPVDIEETTIAGISVAIVTPHGGVPQKNKGRLILNGPGGGFRTGVRGNGLLISIPVAAVMGVKVVSILYRQGPEYQFPAASEDLLKVWDHYTRTYKPQNIGMVGCSAGGSLIAQTTAILIEKGKPTPGALGVYCSGLGAVGMGDSQFFGTLAITNVPAAARQPAIPAPTPGNSNPERNYYTGVDMTQFIVNPTLDEKLLAKFPPTIFFTATRDFAMSGSAYSHRKLLHLNVDSELMVFDGLYHGFMTNPDFPESREGYEIAARFFDKHLGR
jgi:epsilon-lactone hydrolase